MWTEIPALLREFKEVKVNVLSLPDCLKVTRIEMEKCSRIRLPAWDDAEIQ
jgi:hypothetical protein